MAATVCKVFSAGRVILLAALHSVNESSHSSHGCYIIAISRFLSVRVLVFLNSSLMTSQPINRFSAIKYIVCISLALMGQCFLSAPESARIVFRKKCVTVCVAVELLCGLLFRCVLQCVAVRWCVIHCECNTGGLALVVTQPTPMELK